MHLRLIEENKDDAHLIGEMFAEWKSVRIEMEWADQMKVPEARTIEAGAAAFPQKPVDEDKLLAAMQQAVGRT